jgi:hypothetical protein
MVVGEELVNRDGLCFSSCLEEVFSETGLPVYGVLGNSEIVSLLQAPTLHLFGVIQLEKGGFLGPLREEPCCTPTV